MNRIAAILLAGLMAAACGSGVREVTVGDLRCENLYAPLAIDSTSPHFSWKTDAGDRPFGQSAYEIMVASDSLALEEDRADLWSSGKVPSSSSVMVEYGGAPLEAPSLCYWKVRVWDKNDVPSAWSAVARFGTGIPGEGWPGEYVGLKDTSCPIMRRKFTVENCGLTHLLHINTLGYSEVYINGVKVSDDILSPSVSQLDRRSISVTYDITPFLKDGENELVVWLGRGWYRRTIYPSANPFALFRARVDEVSGGEIRTVLSGAEGWQGRDGGYYDNPATTWLMRQFGGEVVDGRVVPSDLTPETLDRLPWKPASVVRGIDLPVTPQMNMPNRIVETLSPVSVDVISDSVKLYDMGRIMTGWLEAEFSDLEEGDRITFTYTDSFDDNGNFRLQEGCPGCYDVYIAAGRDGETFRNRFNHHAFRYVLVCGRTEGMTLRGLRMQESFADASSFECSDSLLNSIYSMIKRTIPNLAFGGYVVDCPHRERMGYGGDGNASRKSVQTLYDTDPLYVNWLRMWADCIMDDGSMPHDVPNLYEAGGGPYWCGFIITASWEAYVNFGDDRLIRRYYPQMKRWLGYVDAHSVDGLLRRWPDAQHRVWYLGDWVAPDTVDYTAPESVDLVNNCFVWECLDAMRKIASVLGCGDESAAFARKRDDLGERINAEFYHADRGVYGTGSQIDQTYPLLCGLARGQAAEGVESALKSYTHETLDDHIGVGLVGVTVLTDWAIRTGNADFVAEMLRKEDYPGYLHMIRHGATATWEEWGGANSRVHNCYNGIGLWFIRGLAGIGPDEDCPGYSLVNVRPQLADGVDWVRATKETPYGTVAVDWTVSGRRFSAAVTVPANSTGRFVFPSGLEKCRIDGRPAASTEPARLEPGRHRITAVILR